VSSADQKTHRQREGIEKAKIKGAYKEHKRVLIPL
jgi:hypothetical protein